MGLLAEAASSLGDAGHAAILYDLLLPYADRIAVSYSEVGTGAVSRYLGLLAATAAGGCEAEAERHFELALEMNEGVGARPWMAHAKREYAGLLLARGGSGDQRKSELLLSEARATYRALGMDVWANRAAALV